MPPEEERNSPLFLPQNNNGYNLILTRQHYSLRAGVEYNSVTFRYGGGRLASGRDKLRLLEITWETESRVSTRDLIRNKLGDGVETLPF